MEKKKIYNNDYVENDLVEFKGGEKAVYIGVYGVSHIYIGVSGMETFGKFSPKHAEHLGVPENSYPFAQKVPAKVVNE